MSLLDLFKFSKSKDYSFKIEQKQLTNKVKLTSYTRAHPDSVFKMDFIENKPLNCNVFFYDENGKKIEFSITQDYNIKNGKPEQEAKPSLIKKINGTTVTLQKSDLTQFKQLAIPHLTILNEKHEEIGLPSQTFFEENTK